MSSDIDRIKQTLRKLSGKVRVTGVYNEHSYVRAWSSLSESERTKPAKMIFMNAILQSNITSTHSDEEIDVSDSPSISPSPFDCQKNKVLADDLERSLKFYLKNDNDGSKLENFPIQNYCSSKQRMYREVMKVVNENTLARMSYSGQPHEFIKRKLIAEKCGRELRYIYANSIYDLDDTIFWVHKVILDKGDVVTIASYINVLQALRLKSPVIVDHIVRSYDGRLKLDYVSQMVKKQWDPSTTVLNEYKPKKIPGTPLIIMCHTGIRHPSKIDKSSRFNRWLDNLSAMCKTMLMNMICDIENLEGAVNEFILSVAAKVIESKNQFPNRPVILAGWSVGALIASYAALKVVVEGVLCFGFPLTGVNGSCVDSDDPLLESEVPILFIVGQNSNMCLTDDIEIFRSRMNTVTGLVIVGGADDFLQVSPNKMILEGISQEIVDRCILDEISEFLENILSVPTAKTLTFNESVIEISDEEVINKDTKTSRKRSKDSSPKQKSTCKCAKATTPKISCLSTKSCSSSSNPQSSNSGCRGKKRVRFKLDDETSVKRKVGRPPGSKNKKKDCTKNSSRVSNEKASRMIKSSDPTSIISTVPRSSLITPSTLDTSYKNISEVHQTKSPVHLPSSPRSCLVLSSKPEASSKVSPAVSNISPTNQKVSRIKSPAGTSIISTIPRSSLITPSTLDTSNKKISEVHQSKSPVHLPSSPKSCLVLLSKPKTSSKVSLAVNNMTPTNQKVSKMIKSSTPTSILLSTPRSSLITPATLDVSNQKFSKVHQSKSPVRSPSLPKSCLVLSSKPKVSSKVSCAVSVLSPTDSVSSPKTSLVSSLKPFPFTIKTLPYGNDNIFMHKPSPPDEEEDTVSADETENNIVEPAAVSLAKPGTSKHTSIGSTDLISQTVMSDEKQISPFFKRSSTAPSCLKATLGTTMKPVLSSSKTVPVYLTPSTFKMAGPSEKSKSISSLIRFRKASDVNLSPFALDKSKSSRSVPLSSKSILVSNKMPKTSPKKVIHVLPKNPISLKTSHELSDVTGSKNNYPSSSNQAIKIVTYANVDDPNQPSNDYCMINRNSATATLVKINAPCDVQNKKQIKVLKVPSTGIKIGTCEETVEKQLTGKVLHESVRLETTTSVPTQNLGYTLCYEKSGGSVISQEVPATASAPNLREPILPFTHIKDQPTMPNKPQ